MVEILERAILLIGGLIPLYLILVRYAG